MDVKGSWNEYQANRGYNLYSRTITILLGVVSIVTGVICLAWVIYSHLDGHMDFNACPLLIISGILVIVYSKRPPRYAVTITAMTLALIVFFKMVSALDTRSLTNLLVMSLYTVAMMIAAVSYFLGNRHNAWRITILVALHGALCVANIAFVLYLNTPWTELWTRCPEDIASLAFCLVFIYYLMQPAVKEDSVNKLMKTGVSTLESVAVSRPSVYITEASLKEMLGQTISTWKFYKEGPLVSEGRSEIIDKKQVFECSSKVWRGENFIRVSFDRDVRDRTFGNGFEIRYITYADEALGRFVYLYGREGFFIKLRVVSEEEKVEEDEIETESYDEVDVR